MAESALTRIRWTNTHKAAVVLELLCGGDTIELASPPAKITGAVHVRMEEDSSLAQRFARAYEKP